MNAIPRRGGDRSRRAARGKDAGEEERLEVEVGQLVRQDVVRRLGDRALGHAVPHAQVGCHSDDLGAGDDEHLRAKAQQPPPVAEEDLGCRPLDRPGAEPLQDPREDDRVASLLADVEARGLAKGVVERWVGAATGLSRDAPLARFPELEPLQEPHERIVQRRRKAGQALGNRGSRPSDLRAQEGKNRGGRRRAFGSTSAGRFGARDHHGFMNVGGRGFVSAMAAPERCEGLPRPRCDERRWTSRRTLPGSSRPVRLDGRLSARRGFFSCADSGGICLASNDADAGDLCQDCGFLSETCQGQTCVSAECGPCSDGCCAGTICVPGSQDTACGTGGVSCQDCRALGQLCGSGKSCGGSEPCNAATCPGCCAGDACLSGYADFACGRGVACVDCQSMG